MNKSDQLWKSLEDEEYRRAFIADDTGLAFQIKLLRDKKGWTQAELGERAGGKRQETISQWENPNYGKYSLSTLKELATAFDVGMVVRFAPFSELVEWNANLTPERIAPPSFDEEQQSRGRFESRVVYPSESVTVAASQVNVSGLVTANDLIAAFSRLNDPDEDPIAAALRWVASTTVEPKEDARALAA